MESGLRSDIDGSERLMNRAWAVCALDAIGWDDPDAPSPSLTYDLPPQTL